MTETTTQNPAARDAAFAAMAAMATEPTGQIEYASQGRVLVIGDGLAWRVGAGIAAPLKPMIVTDSPRPDDIARAAPCYAPGGTELVLKGHLGQFRLEMRPEDDIDPQVLLADLVLDLGEAPLLDRTLNPPGYFHAGSDPARLEIMLGQLSDLVGSFEKPRYFAYDADICAQGRSGIKGCNRCVEVCPAEAITALAERIEVDPYLCQGGGACATACPTGAIRYTYPRPADTLERMRVLLGAFREKGGDEAVILFVAEADISELPDNLPASVLPVALEELASVGMEVWLAALCYGAEAVILYRGASVPAAVAELLAEQVDVANSVLAGLGYPAFAVALQTDVAQVFEPGARLKLDRWAGFSGIDDKRQAFFLALDHLYEQAPTPVEQTPLSAGAPFGQIHIDGEACTLCMGCTSVCPVHAVQAGNERPALQFFESRCVQCGICADACPESAITLSARIINDPEMRRPSRVLHEEPPFECIGCGKPFATKSVIDTMLQKLSGHYMFQSERARRRLMMCEDCRVVDAVQDDEAMKSGLSIDLHQQPDMDGSK